MSSVDEYGRWASLILFLAGFAAFLVLEKHRHWTALIVAAVAVLAGVLTPAEALQAVNWPIVIVFFATLACAEVFMLSGAAAVAAEAILARFRTPVYAILALCAMTGFLSLFIENVACVLVAAPIALSLADRLKIPPQPVLVACALASNLQGCGLLIGDPPSMLLAAEANLSFLDFVIYEGRPSIFWAVQVGALAGLAFLYFVFRKHSGTVHTERSARLISVVPSLCLLALVGSLGIATQVEKGIGALAAASCAFFTLLSYVWLFLKTRGTSSSKYSADGGLPSFMSMLKTLDWQTVIFVAAVFVPVAAFARYGWVDAVAALILGVSGKSLVLTFIVIVLTSMLVSAFVDNIPFLLIMLPAVSAMGASLGIPATPIALHFGLLLGVSVGGNITPIGAQANIAAVGLLRKRGSPISFRAYIAISLPYSLIAVAAACLFVYIVYGL